MKEFLFRLPFAIFGAYIGRKYGGDLVTTFCCSLIGCVVGDLLISLM